MNLLWFWICLATTASAFKPKNTMRLDQVNINRSVKLAKEALAALVTSGEGDGKYKVKACCVCDCLIRHGKEKALSLDRLRALKPYFTADNTDVANRSYAQTCYPTRGHNNIPFHFLKGMMLSPRSYKITARKSRKEVPGLGCCTGCYSGMGSPKSNAAGHAQAATAVLPKYAIANGWCIGTPPAVLTALNEVELAIVSPARINKHVFAFQAGNHRTIKGWHSLYYNDLSHFEAVQEHVREIVTAPTISVVLVGPFTQAQKRATLKRTTVSWHKVNKAIEWLKLHNHLYHAFVAPDKAHVQPIIVDER